MRDKKSKEGKGVEVTPLVDGLRRSRRLRALPPHPPPQPMSEVGGSMISARKRKGTGPPEQGNGAKKKVTDVGDDVSAKVKVNGAGKDETSSAEPILAKNGRTDDDKSRVGVAKRREPSGSSSREGAAAAGGAGRRSEIQSSSEGVPHPCLFIENILDVVFKHILKQTETGQGRGRGDVGKDVRNIRQVCKTWKASITPLYRRTGATATFDDYFNVIYGKPGREQEQRNLAKFLDTMRPSEMIPVQKFIFENGSVLGPAGEPELFREFLVMCGPEAVSLDLTIRSCESEKIISNLMDLSELNLARLRRLKLTIFENHQVTFQADRLPGNVKLIERLLTAAKSLREFELSYPPLQLISHRDQEVILVQQLLPTIAKRLPASVKKLKLTVEMEMSESSLDSLAGIQSRLEGFELLDLDVPSYSTMGSKTIWKFLQSQAATLQRLQLQGCIGINGPPFVGGFPALHELAQLEMSRNDVISITAPFEFAELFPKLRCLKIDMKNGGPFLTALSRQNPLPSLKVLHLSVRNLSIEPGLLKGIAKSFPCLAELRVGLFDVTKETMGELFTYFDNLDLLNITGLDSSVRVESLFSGIAESECSRIKESQDFEKESLKELQRQPSLLNLTKLRKLVVDSYWTRSLTDFSAHFVFMEMENLRELHLPRGGWKFSPKYRDLLRAKLDKLVLSE